MATIHKVTGVKIHCDKCGANAVGMQSHVDRFHKMCGKSVKGERRNTHGQWKPGHKEALAS